MDGEALTEMKITLPYPPSLNRMYRSVKGRVLLSKDGRQYKSNIEQICTVKRIKPFSGEVSVKVDLFRPEKRGDLDNSLKALLDSIQGFAYHNDAQIVHINAFRHDDKADPRVEVEITEV